MVDGGGWPKPCSGRFTPRSDPVPIYRRLSGAPGSFWTVAENLALPRDSIPRRLVSSRFTDYPIPAHMAIPHGNMGVPIGSNVYNS